MLNGALTVGSLTSFSMYTGYLYVSVGQVSVAISEFMKAQGASRRVFTVIDSGTLNMETGGLRLPSNYLEKVEFRNVHFAYPTRPDHEVYVHTDCARVVLFVSIIVFIRIGRKSSFNCIFIFFLFTFVTADPFWI